MANYSATTYSATTYDVEVVAVTVPAVKPKTWRRTSEPMHTFWYLDVKTGRLVASSDLTLPVNIQVSTQTMLSLKAFTKPAYYSELIRKVSAAVRTTFNLKITSRPKLDSGFLQAFKAKPSMDSNLELPVKAESHQLNRIEEALREWLVKRLMRVEALVPTRSGLYHIIHDRTKTSKAVRTIEDKLARDLDRLVSRILAEQGTVSIASFPGAAQTRYDPEVRALIRSAVQQSYQAGINYTSDFFKVPPVMSDQDVRAMNDETDRRVAEFWVTVMRLAHRQDMEPAKNPFNSTAAMAMAATVLTVSALALATWNKTRQLSPDTELIWITALDDRVCPICRPLHGRVWTVSDPDLIIPPDDTHPNCRCRLLIRDSGDIFSH